MKSIKKRLDALRSLIQTPEFLEGRGLSNEVNIRIFCYDPKEEMTVRYFCQRLLQDRNLSCRLIHYNLYQVFLDICWDKRILDKIPDLEEKRGKNFLLNQLQRMVNNETFAKKTQYPDHQTGDVVMITGVGAAYPFIRVHALLDAIQPFLSDVPVVVMYPGTFDGRYIKLFNRLKPNAYYRAFNIV